MGSIDNHVHKEGIPEGDGHKLDVLNGNVHGSEVLDRSPQEIGATDAKLSDATDIANAFTNGGDEVTLEEPSDRIGLDDTCSLNHTLASNEAHVSSKAEAIGDNSESVHISVELCNGFKENSTNFQADGPCGSGDNRVELSSSGEFSDQSIGLSLIGNDILPKLGDQNSSGNDEANNASKPSSPIGGGSTAMCFYQCCSECFVSLHQSLLRIINTQWEIKGSGDSTVEDVHDFVASLSAKLHLSLSKLSRGENACGSITEEDGKNSKSCECLKFQDKKNSDKWITTECGCHETNKKRTGKENLSCFTQALEESRFVFKDGVLANLDTGTDDVVPYHCKFERLCLCFLIDWLVIRKGIFL